MWDQTKHVYVFVSILGINVYSLKFANFCFGKFTDKDNWDVRKIFRILFSPHVLYYGYVCTLSIMSMIYEIGKMSKF
jgi:hypothetical protein